jgi:hypothetical protein
MEPAKFNAKPNYKLAMSGSKNAICLVSVFGVEMCGMAC